jgi:glucosamine kinase
MRKILDLEEIERRGARACMGMAGTEAREQVDRFTSLKPDWMESLELVSDAHTACVGAHQGEDGAVVIVGTGVVGYQVEGGRSSRAGGWGFPQSDEGGGAWLGMEAARLAFQASDGVIPQSDTSRAVLARFDNSPFALLDRLVGAPPSVFGELAPLVVHNAEAGDEAAISLMRQSGEYLSGICRALASKQKASKPLPVSFLGGLAPFMEHFVDDATSARLRPARSDALTGAMLMLERSE